ncbi:MAG: DNA adenine methylase [Acidobacteria bacterium RIFCSPLOWO2_02_FULL_60_20]|nr:MAG: DNA adenine methylase [Acidobacteria bacterium RIFCSPLOWO2_02_FULL_60_20]
MSGTLLKSASESARCCDPLLKWPGGKRRLVQFILRLLPQRFGRYYEPFLGGGALFFALQPRPAHLSDNNAELISAYLQVRNHPKAVIKQLAKLRNGETEYYAIRSEIPRTEAAKAARIIYLTTLAFNGIHRVNLRGEFNVPYGRKAHLRPCEPEKIMAVSKLLKKAAVKYEDFQVAVAGAQRGDAVYLDPPYTVAHSNNGFLKYNAKIFSWEDQKRLAEVAQELALKGCTVVVSNADHPSIRALYRSFDVLEIERHSVIAASSEFRRPITECVFHNRHGKNA